MVRGEGVEAARNMGRFRSVLVEDGDAVLTDCNAGALAPAGYGTALAVVRSAVEDGKNVSVIATETRPLLQGSRSTPIELSRYAIPGRLICDSAPAYLMAQGVVRKVVVGADRGLGCWHVCN